MRYEGSILRRDHPLILIYVGTHSLKAKSYNILLEIHKML